MASLQNQISEMLSSTPWKITAHLRGLRRVFRSRFVNDLRRATRVAYWLVTFQIFPRLRERRLVRQIYASGWFDVAFYTSRYPDIAAAGIDSVLHYLTFGAAEGRDPGPSFSTQYYLQSNPDVAATGVNPLVHYLGRQPRDDIDALDITGKLDSGKETIIVVSHEASRTGAPILALNIIKHLKPKYNVIAFVLGPGGIIVDFEREACAVLETFKNKPRAELTITSITKHIQKTRAIKYALVNSIESHCVLRPFALNGIPTISLIHEFASYIRPLDAVLHAHTWSTEIVFSASIVAQNHLSLYPQIPRGKIHILPQGRCVVPSTPSRTSKIANGAETLRRQLRPVGDPTRKVILGCGTVQLRKGVDLFLDCAVELSRRKLPVETLFVWIGRGYDPENDVAYSVYLADQITRAGLADKVKILDETPDIEVAFRCADVFFLSSRLDPLPNTTIDALTLGIPVVCFDRVTGIADLMKSDVETAECVVPYLDVRGAADVIARLVCDPDLHRSVSTASRHLAERTFDMQHYVEQLDEMGVRAATIKTIQESVDNYTLIRDDPDFEQGYFMVPSSPRLSRDEAIDQFVCAWAQAGPKRKPCAGFNPQIYADDVLSGAEIGMRNPFAHFIERGKPKGPWLTKVIQAQDLATKAPTQLRVALHIHAHYPDLIGELRKALSVNASRCDLFVSTSSKEGLDSIRQALAGFDKGNVHLSLVPNRGRDIGPFLTEYRWLTDKYDLIGHVHCKKSPYSGAEIGGTWRRFLWSNLIGNANAMMDEIGRQFEAEAALGLVFPDDPNVIGWDSNKAIAQRFAHEMGLSQALPDAFNFPVGTMFWCRGAALRPLFELGLDWEDFPPEPLPNDGTILHAMERLLPFVARHQGYKIAVTHVRGVTR